MNSDFIESNIHKMVNTYKEKYFNIDHDEIVE